jgi:hypothetical protein
VRAFLVHTDQARIPGHIEARIATRRRVEAMAAAAHLGETDQGLTITRPKPPSIYRRSTVSFSISAIAFAGLRLSDKSGVVQHRVAAVGLMMLHHLTLAVVRQFTFSYQSRISARFNYAFAWTMI